MTFAHAGVASASGGLTIIRSTAGNAQTAPVLLLRRNEWLLAAADYQLLPLNPAAAPEPEPFTEIHAVGTLKFPQVTSPSSRHGRVQVTGTWGWTSIPDAVQQACLLVANRLVKRRHSPEGVAGFDEFGTIRISARDDPDAVRYLMPYKTSRRAGGWAIA